MAEKTALPDYHLISLDFWTFFALYRHTTERTSDSRSRKINHLAFLRRKILDELFRSVTYFTGPCLIAELFYRAWADGLSLSAFLSLEPAMINWPELLRHAEDWTNGFFTGAAVATSLIVIVGAAMVVLVRPI